MKKQQSNPILFALTAMAAMLFSCGAVLAAEVMPDYEASPAHYKVLKESDDMRIVMGTWPPGAKDKLHSHPGDFAVYVLNDCHRKLYKPDGSVANEKNIKAGTAAIKKPVKGHVFENVGTSECKILLVELKK